MIDWDSCVLWLDLKYFSESYWWDRSKYRNDGAVHSVKWKANSFYFDGINDYVDCGNHESLNITNELTLEAWVQQVTNNNGYIVIKNTSNDSKRLYSIYSAGSNDKVYFYYYDGNFRQVYWNYALDDNKIHHVVIRVSELIATLFVNGENQGNQTLNSAFQGDISAKVKIGKREPNDYYFKGNIYTLRIYKKALSDKEIEILNSLSYRRW